MSNRVMPEHLQGTGIQQPLPVPDAKQMSKCLCDPKGGTSLNFHAFGRNNCAPGSDSTFTGTYGCCIHMSGNVGKPWWWIWWFAMAGGQAMSEVSKEGFFVGDFNPFIDIYGKQFV